MAQADDADAMLIVGTWTYVGSGWLTIGDAACASRRRSSLAQNNRRPTHVIRHTEREGEQNVEKLLYTTTEAADMLGIGRSKIYELMDAGVLRSVKIGRARRIPAEAFRACIESLAEAAA